MDKSVQALLKVENLSLKFGGLLAVNNVSFEVEEGQIVSIIGPNGAGKTSLFNLISGLYHPSSGQIFFQGRKLVADFPLKRKLQWLLLSVFFGFTFVLLINAQELWQQSISSVYVYQQEFKYSQALEAAYSYLSGLHYSWTLLPFLGALGLSLAAAYQFESSAKIGPVVAARAGIARTFQNLRLMASSSVLENIKVACRQAGATPVLAAMLSLPSARKYESRIEAQAHDSLKILELDSFAESQAGSLPYGIQRRVEIARALAAHPKLIILDEPAAGLNPSESHELLQVIRKIAKSGKTILLIEHDMSVVMGVSDKIVVLHHGSNIAQGTPAEIKANPEVAKAYLGDGNV